MTEHVTPDVAQPAEDDPPTPGPEGGPTWHRTPRPLGAVGRYVDRQVNRLLAGLTSGRHANTALAALAHLRNAVGREPGSVPEVWDLTLDGVPGVPIGEEPTREERAVHTAMTLFAVHQQARPDPMQLRGVGFGESVARLERKLAGDAARSDDRISPTRRRLNVIVTATSFAETVHHLRTVIGQLRAASIPLDYGQLADDLFALQFPPLAQTVRLRWARQYYGLDRQVRREPLPDAAGSVASPLTELAQEDQL